MHCTGFINKHTGMYSEIESLPALLSMFREAINSDCVIQGARAVGQWMLQLAAQCWRLDAVSWREVEPVCS